jgi:hypothetical protein
MSGRRHLQLVKELSQVATLLGLLAGGGWAVWTFIFQHSVLPARLPAHLNVDSKLEVLGRTTGKPGLIAVKASVQVKNGSTMRACVVGSTFNMRAFHISPSFYRSIPQQVSLIKQGNGDFVELPQTVILGAGDIVNSGRLFSPNGAWLEAGQEQMIEFVTFVPDEYGLVRLRSDLRVSKSRDSDTERCYSDKLDIDWEVSGDGLVTMRLSMIEDGRRVAYDYRRHKDHLKSYVPYHIISFSYAALNLEQKSSD